MIGFMLNYSCRKVLRFEFNAFSMPIQSGDGNVEGTRDKPADVGDAETTFPTFDSFVADHRNLWVHERDRIVFAPPFVIEVGDEQAKAFVHLGRGQTDAGVLVHGVDHVVDQLLHQGGLQLLFVNHARLLAEHRGAHSRHFQNGNTADLILVASLAEAAAEADDNWSPVHSHDLTPPYRFCPVCGSTLEARVLKVTEPRRLVCTNSACGFVFYLDPKIAVGTIIRMNAAPASDATSGIVLVRRAIEPGYGKWVFPGGYVDRGEEITLAAIREAREESGLDVRIDHLVNIYSYAGRTPIVVVYAATCVGGELAVDDEGLEARSFEPSAIPWNDLAFRSTREALRDYLKART
jgi:8-oxo-dGTP diphosphatase